MRDHRYLPIQFRLNAPGFSTNREYRGARLLKNVLQYYLMHTGPMSWAIAEIAAFIKTSGDLERSDAHLVMQSFSWAIPKEGVAPAPESEPGFGLIAGISRSETQGTVLIHSADPKMPPSIDYQPLSDERDQRVAPRLLRYVRSFCEQPALRPHVTAELAPGRLVQTDDEIIAAFKERGTMGLHTVGTCKMGADALAVVDQRLRVRGIRNLRVADCSVIPTCITGSGGTSAAAMMIGWRAAEFALEDGRYSRA
jgi:choline dehydrogenase